tara:strand:- start:155 stop:883 length:729 start_codon:yes stop_codon:yes gene_type:complete
MKKLLVLLLVVASTIATAQESVKLRLNYKKGDTYKMNMLMTQSSSVMGMTMNMKMNMAIIDIIGDSYLTEMSFESMKMNMLQGGQEMNYDSEAKDEDLDPMGQMMKNQMGPILTVVVKGTLSKLGKMSDVTVTPDLPNTADFTKTSSIAYPKESVIVGSTWEKEEITQGMTIVMTYTVKEITETKVNVNVTGASKGAAVATITGSLEIEKASGMPVLSIINTKISAGGQDVSMEVKTTMDKL